MGAQTREIQSGASQFWSDLMTVPNLLSCSRIVGIFLSMALYLNGYRGAGLIVGTIAGVTDILDGWLARKLNQATELGAILDRLSDLILEAVGFAFLLHFQLLSPVFFIAYLFREFMVMSARLYVAEQGGTIASSFIGKFKTDLIAGSLVGLLAAHSGLVSPTGAGDILYKVGYAMMVGGLILSYVSGAQYIKSFMKSYGSSAT